MEPTKRCRDFNTAEPEAKKFKADGPVAPAPDSALPNEILESIFLQLEFNALGKVPQVSKNWNLVMAKASKQYVYDQIAFGPKQWATQSECASDQSEEQMAYTLLPANILNRLLRRCPVAPYIFPRALDVIAVQVARLLTPHPIAEDDEMGDAPDELFYTRCEEEDGRGNQFTTLCQF